MTIRWNKTEDVKKLCWVGDVTAAHGHFVFPCQESWLANLWAEWEKQRDTDRHRILKAGLEWRQSSPFTSCCYLPSGIPRRGEGQFCDPLEGAGHRGLAVWRGQVSAAQGTPSKRSWHKRVTRLNGEKRYWKTPRHQGGGLMRLTINAKKVPPEPRLEKHRKIWRNERIQLNGGCYLSIAFLEVVYWKVKWKFQIAAFTLVFRSQTGQLTPRFLLIFAFLIPYIAIRKQDLSRVIQNVWQLWKGRSTLYSTILWHFH